MVLLHLTGEFAVACVHLDKLTANIHIIGVGWKRSLTSFANFLEILLKFALHADGNRTTATENEALSLNCFLLIFCSWIAPHLYFTLYKSVCQINKCK